MRKKALINIFLLVAVCGGLWAAGPVAAQGGGARTIPIPGALLTAKTSPDGRLAAVYELAFFHDFDDLVDDYLPVRLVDLETEVVTPLPGPADYAYDVAFTPNSATLAGCYATGQIILWDTATGLQRQAISLMPTISGCAFLPDGQTLVVVYRLASLSAFLLVDTASGAITRILSYPFRSFGQFRDVTSDSQNFPLYALAAFTVSPDGSQIIMSAQNDNLWIWDVGGAPPVLFHDSGETLPMLSIRRLALTPDGSTVVYLHQFNSGIYGVSLVDGEVTPILALENAPLDFALAPDGDRLAVTHRHTPAITVSSLSQPDSAITVDLPLPKGADLSLPVVAFATSTRLVVTGMNTSETGENAIFVLDVPAP